MVLEEEVIVVATKGKGWHGDSDGHARAGRKGGETTARQKGQAFYSEIGRRGGKSSSKRNKAVIDDSGFMDLE